MYIGICASAKNAVDLDARVPRERDQHEAHVAVAGHERRGQRRDGAERRNASHAGRLQQQVERERERRSRASA